jgi:hypothetical protein
VTRFGSNPKGRRSRFERHLRPRRTPLGPHNGSAETPSRTDTETTGARTTPTGTTVPSPTSGKRLIAYAQGAIVLIEDPYRDGLGLVLVVSNAERSYRGKQYTVAVITRTERGGAIEVSADDLMEGSLNCYPICVNPWSLHEFEHEDVDRRVARVDDDIGRDVALGVHRFAERR